jgi:hypothetical protein
MNQCAGTVVGASSPYALHHIVASKQLKLILPSHIGGNRNLRVSISIASGHPAYIANYDTGGSL